jgi:hypothetical protein
MNTMLKEASYHLPNEETSAEKAIVLFREQPGKFITVGTIFRHLGWENTYTAEGHLYTRDNVRELVSQVRAIIHNSPGTAGYLLNIFNEDGYAYYPSIPIDKRIAPVGFRPIPAWEGDTTRIAQLQALFTSLQYAEVRPGNRLARPSLPKTDYKCLLILAQAYAKGHDQAVEERQLDLDDSYDVGLIRERRCLLKKNLERLTQGQWTIEHKKALGESWEKGRNYLVYRPIALSEPVISSSPPSLSTT